MKSIVKVGIISCGGIAFKKHMPCLKNIPNVQMVAFCDLVLERAEKAKKEFGIENAQVTTDFREVLANTQVEVVHVLTPNKQHAEIAIAAMLAGKDVMVEKPMAKTAEEAEEMLKISKMTGRKLSVSYQNRFRVGSIYAKRYIQAGNLGEIYYANVYALRRRGTPVRGVFLDPEQQGGGPVIDILTHSLDLALYLMDNYEPKYVVGKTHKKLEHPEAGNCWGKGNISQSPLEESAAGLLVMKNGATLLLETSWSLNTENEIAPGSVRLCGSKGGLSILNDKLRVNYVEDEQLVEREIETDVSQNPLYKTYTNIPSQLELNDWIESIALDRTPTCKAEEALIVSRIVSGFYQSSETGEPFYFD